MRSFNRVAVGVAVVAGTCLVGAGAMATTVPPDDDSAAALEQFTELAERSGYTLVDPACSASPDGADLTFTCYAMTTAGGPFIARTTLSSGDVVEFEILAQPGESVDATVPPAEADEETTTGFDPLAYFDTLFSADADQIATLQSMTATGSPAEAYALYQLAFAQSLAAFGGEVEPSHVYLTEDGVLVCVMPDSCVYAADLEVIDGQLANFTVDGEEIAPRLGRPGQPTTVGPVTARIQAAYRAVTGADNLPRLRRAVVDVRRHVRDVQCGVRRQRRQPHPGRPRHEHRSHRRNRPRSGVAGPRLPGRRPRWRTALPRLPPRRRHPTRRRATSGAGHPRAGSHND